MSGKIIYHVPYERYSQWPHMNISKLKNMGKSAKHFQYYKDHPPTSKPMSLGTAAHCAVLEPERFAAEYVVWARMSDNGNQAPRRGQHWDAFISQNEGKKIVTVAEFEAARAMAKAVRADAVAMKYLEQGVPEVAFEWTMKSPEEYVGVACKARVDWLTDSDGVPTIVGLKTARDIRTFPFGSAAAKLGYALQWAWYCDGYMEITGNCPRVKEIVVESFEPHDVIVYDITEDILLEGHDEYMRLLKLYVEACKTNTWLGVSEGREHVLSMPTWFYQQSTDGDISDLELEDE